MPVRPLPVAAVLSLSVLAALAGGCGHDHAGHHDQADTAMTRLSLADAPAAVGDAVRREYPGGHVNYVGKHEMGDHTHYHVELTTADGKTVYRTYSPTGADMSDPH